jgi:hypothetical protein
MESDCDDTDGDGVCDSVDACPGFDDSIDADNDGLPDLCDGCPYDPENDADSDDICGDVDDCPYDPDNDADFDGVCGDVDACPGFDDRLDEDEDGLPDDCDDCPLDPENDADLDGICGDVDPCPYDFDNDADLDGFCGDVDDCPDVPGVAPDGCPPNDGVPPVLTSRSHDSTKKEIRVYFETDEPATGLVCPKSGSCVSTPLDTSHDTDWFRLKGKTYTIEVSDADGNAATYGPFKK